MSGKSCPCCEKYFSRDELEEIDYDNACTRCGFQRPPCIVDWILSRAGKAWLRGDLAPRKDLRALTTAQVKGIIRDARTAKAQGTPDAWRAFYVSLRALSDAELAELIALYSLGWGNVDGTFAELIWSAQREAFREESRQEAIECLADKKNTKLPKYLAAGLRKLGDE